MRQHSNKAEGQASHKQAGDQGGEAWWIISFLVWWCACSRSSRASDSCVGCGSAPKRMRHSSLVSERSERRAGKGRTCRARLRQMAGTPRFARPTARLTEVLSPIAAAPIPPAPVAATPIATADPVAGTPITPAPVSPPPAAPRAQVCDIAIRGVAFDGGVFGCFGLVRIRGTGFRRGGRSKRACLGNTRRKSRRCRDEQAGEPDAGQHVSPRERSRILVAAEKRCEQRPRLTPYHFDLSLDRPHH